MRAFLPDPKVITEELRAVLESMLWVTGLEPQAEHGAVGATGQLLTHYRDCVSVGVHEYTHTYTHARTRARACVFGCESSFDMTWRQRKRFADTRDLSLCCVLQSVKSLHKR